MQKNKLNYLRDIKEALKTYNEEHQIVDFELIQKIYGYSENLDNLTEIELHELDSFIAENTISIHHLANIYLDKKGEEDTKQPVFSNMSQSGARRSREEISYVATMPQSNDDDDDDGGELLDDTDYDFPPFLRDKNF